MILVDYAIGVFPVHTRDEDQLDGWKTSWRDLNELTGAMVEIAQCCRYTRPLVCHMQYLAMRLRGFGSLFLPDTSDVAHLIYAYHTHRQPLPEAEYNDGMTGHTGILEEIMAGVPLQGMD